ncbi:glycosyltransferase [Paraburkholderia caribensis]|uniref:glycosyltransferase n=1 Tax=Paraburkholderia caribensis TaxID=75105 RepID=UPI0015E747DF|nr:glycosyltransferase [Paraburkholderia caribensis]
MLKRHVQARLLALRLKHNPQFELAEFFDAKWYLTHYPDVRAGKADPLLHYLKYGASEGRNPSDAFDTKFYLLRNPDVREIGINPLVHYLLYGRKEGRMPRPAGGLYSTSQLSAKLNREVPGYLREWQKALPEGEAALGGSADIGILEPYSAWRAVNALSDIDIHELRSALAQRAGKLPKISIITPIYNTAPELFEQLERAVAGQIYTNWEWCLADDGSPSPHVRPMLERARSLDNRIKVVRLEKNGGISIATNAAVENACGEIIAFVDHDDLITSDCLAEMALYYADHPDADVVYSDDDKVDTAGRHFAPQFKPDWSPVLLLSYMYMGHVFTVRRALFRELGGFRKPFDGSQDYDFALRAVEKARHVGHVSKILYNWRVVPGSTAASGDAKPASFEAGRKAVEEAIERRGLVGATVVQPEWARAAKVGMFEVDFSDDGPSVSIVIPTKNQMGFLKTCVESLSRTTYRNFDVLVVDNGSDDPKTLEYLDSLKGRPRHAVVRIPSKGGRFSFSALMNEAVTHCRNDYVLFLNNDTEVISERWLSAMMGYAQMEKVGAVGARLYFEDRTIQHAGIVHGYNEGMVGHAFRCKPPHDWGYLGFIRTAREYSAVTAACMVTPRKLFNEIGGFDETDFAVAYNDVDYCYRLIQAGWHCVYAPQAELFHFEGKSRGFNDNPREISTFRKKYGKWADRWYNRNLSLENEWFEAAAARPQTRREGPVHVLFVTHNLNHEGAPIFLLDLAKGLVDHGSITATVVSPCDGPLREDYEREGIKVHVLDDPAAMRDEYAVSATLDTIGKVFSHLDAEVVLANTLNSFWAVAGATAAGIPAIWCQHESEPWSSYFDYLPPAARAVAYGAFAQAYRVLYVAEATRRAWRDVETRGNMRVVRYGIPPMRLAEETQRWSREEARAKLGVEGTDVVVTIVGTVCRRKGQLDLAEAFALLSPQVQQRVRVFLAGKSGEQPYFEEIEKVIAGLPSAVRQRVALTGPVEDPFVYYKAADVYVCSSHIESAPRVLVEAMACGLPIITTPVFGIPEQVKENVNALFFQPGDVERLSKLVTDLTTHDTLREELRSKSKAVLESLPGFEEMIHEYTKLIREAMPLDVRSLNDKRWYATRGA